MIHRRFEIPQAFDRLVHVDSPGQVDSRFKAERCAKFPLSGINFGYGL
jgi:hypothetical protein